QCRHGSVHGEATIERARSGSRRPSPGPGAVSGEFRHLLSVRVRLSRPLLPVRLCTAPDLCRTELCRAEPAPALGCAPLGTAVGFAVVGVPGVGARVLLRSGLGAGLLRGSNGGVRRLLSAGVAERLLGRLSKRGMAPSRRTQRDWT